MIRIRSQSESLVYEYSNKERHHRQLMPLYHTLLINPGESLRFIANKTRNEKAVLLVVDSQPAFHCQILHENEVVDESLVGQENTFVVFASELEKYDITVKEVEKK